MDVNEQPSQSDVAARLRAMQARRRHATRYDTPVDTRVMLPVWPDAVRAIPNVFLRSALFGVIGRGRAAAGKSRLLIDKKLLSSLGGISIRYTGPQLDQNDLTAYESVLHAVRFTELDEQCRVTSYAILKLMGLTDTGKNRKTLFDRITRLRAATVVIKVGAVSYIGGLISEARRDDRTQEWIFVLSPRIRTLFANDQYTLVDWSVRRALTGQQLAQWLYGFYASHAKPLQLKIETIYGHCGSTATVMTDFTKTLKKALRAMVLASPDQWNPKHPFKIEDGLVYVYKRAKGAQQRHLDRARQSS